MTVIDSYLMNPAEDTIIFGDELAEGMWVLPESPTARCAANAPEEAQWRGQSFRRITRLRVVQSENYLGGSASVFIGEWSDGFQETHRVTTSACWIVKKDSIPS